jgi:hypothetical protein
VAGLGIPLLPFAIMAPGNLARGVLITQMARNADGTRNLLARLVDMAGLRLYPGKLPNEAVLGVLALALLACWAWAYLGGRSRRRRGPGQDNGAGYDSGAGQDGGPGWLDVYALAGAVATTAMFLVPSFYYSHYGAFSGAFLGLAVALPVGTLATRLSSGERAERRMSAEADAGADVLGVGVPVPAAGRPLAIGVTALLAVIVALCLAGATEVQLRWESTWSGVQVTGADSLIAPGSCVLTNYASYTVAADRFFATDPGCPAMVDSFGTLFAMTGGASSSASPSQLRPVVDLWMSSLEHAQYFWITEDTTTQVPWNAQLLGYFHAHFRLTGLARKTTLVNPAAPEPGLYRHI